MHIAIVSVSADPAITFPLLQRIADALDVQQNAHYAPFWQSCGVAVRAYASLTDIPVDASPIIVQDEPDRTGTLAWHASTDEGLPFGRVFWDPIRRHGGSLIDGPMSLSSTLSHEVLEAVGNPYVNFWADMPGGLQEAVELCDRVEADAYPIDGVSMSNFLGPRAFRNGPGPYDWMRLLEDPWELRPGGYCIRRGPGTPAFEVWGRGFPEWKRQLKSVEGSRMQRRHTVL